MRGIPVRRSRVTPALQQAMPALARGSAIQRPVPSNGMAAGQWTEWTIQGHVQLGAAYSGDRSFPYDQDLNTSVAYTELYRERGQKLSTWEDRMARGRRLIPEV